ncbi:class I adenylate-forming enzyme family protein [Pseudonocardia sp. NPDC049154]|uniref:class I adenylate-forming enzyme family protein n=1 Tax=Pseudonocardia sp. NPDC049154 TaxID=3155501 RepID=UPI0033C3669A
MLVDSTVGGRFAEVAERRARATALVWDDGGELRSLDFTTLHSRVRGAAARLLELAEPGDRVALWAANSVDWIVAEYAVATAGMVLVPMNPALTATEAAFVLSDSGARVVLAGPPWRGRDLLGTARELDGNRTVLPVEEVAQLTGTVAPSVGVTPDTPLRIQYTSGTTGVPKGALIDHRLGANIGPISHATIGLTETDVVCSPLPFHHVGGSVCTSSAALLRGATFVLMASFEPLEALSLLERAQVTFFGGVPTMMVAIMERCGGTPPPLPHLRLMMLGGSDVAPELIARVEQAFDAEILNGYGQSEAPSALQTHVGDEAWVKAGTIGRVNPHREARITDPATGEPVPPGTTGELRLRGPLTIRRYWNEAPDGPSVLVDEQGWLHTGDLAEMDADGIVTLRGRLKELVIRGGENIYPAEVEAALAQHPGIAEIAVVGASDPTWGQVPVAFVRPLGDPPTAEELEAFARERLASFKVPRTWRFVSEFPLTPSGKIQKFRLARELSDDTGPARVG